MKLDPQLRRRRQSRARWQTSARGLLLGTLLGWALTTLSVPGCSGSTCQNLAHVGCVPDGGSSCGAGNTCLDVGTAIDPCQSGALACCFKLCSSDKDCSDNESCVDSGSVQVCAQGRCTTTE
jgi:hypothetical protein